jgi:hypothetical protein
LTDGVITPQRRAEQLVTIHAGIPYERIPQRDPNQVRAECVLLLLGRRAIRSDLHDVRLVLSQPGIDAHGVCL